MRDLQPAYDAEKVGEEQLKTKFRPAPSLAAAPGRSTLLVGTRGCGKTMLLQLLRYTYKGVAVYADLGRKILRGISADTGAAGLTFDTIPPAMEGLLQDKAVSLLALWLADQATRRGLSPSDRLLRRVLPNNILVDAPANANLIEWLSPRLDPSSLLLFRVAPNIPAFFDFCYDIAEQAQSQTRLPLLLLLDRAEEVPYPALVPVLSLLDQTHPFLTIVACRPGILGPSPDVHSTVPSPGDHYDIRHLGFNPYSTEWRAFQLAVLQAWIPQTVRAFPPSEIDLLLRTCRDSVRSALEIAFNSLSDDGDYDRSRSRKVTCNLQVMLLNAAQGQLRRLNSDLSRLINRVRRSTGFGLPVLLRLPDKHPMPLLRNVAPLPESTRTEQFARLGLRTGLLGTPDGTPWHPQMTLDALELHPLYLWQDGDEWRG